MKDIWQHCLLSKSKTPAHMYTFLNTQPTGPALKMLDSPWLQRRSWAAQLSTILRIPQLNQILVNLKWTTRKEDAEGKLIPSLKTLHQYHPKSLKSASQKHGYQASNLNTTKNNLTQQPPVVQRIQPCDPSSGGFQPTVATTNQLLLTTVQHTHHCAARAQNENLANPAKNTATAAPATAAPAPPVPSSTDAVRTLKETPANPAMSTATATPIILYV